MQGPRAVGRARRDADHVRELGQLGCLRGELVLLRPQRDEDARAGVAQQVGLLRRRQQPVHADEERAEPLRGEKQNRELDVVREARRHARARPDAERGERVRGAIRGAIQLAEAEAPVSPDQRLALGMRRDAAVDDLGRALGAAARKWRARGGCDQSERSEVRGHARSVALPCAAFPGGLHARSRDSRRHAHRRQRRSGAHRRRRHQRRAHPRSRARLRQRAPHARRRRPRGHARLRRHPHPLRRAGHLGSAAGAVLLSRRHHARDGQLRRRLRASKARRARLPDRPDGRRRGHPGHGAARRHPVGVGDLPRVPRCAGEAPLPDGRGDAGAARRGARLRDGRARREERARHARRISPRWPRS